MPETAETLSASDPIYARLDEQIQWYGSKSSHAQRMFKRIKMIEIIAAAAIPFLAGFSIPDGKLVIAGLGVLITILEGVLHLNQYQALWGDYRSTCEALKHEKFVYLAKAGPYAAAADPYALLAERIESLISQEHAQWNSYQQQAGKSEAKVS
jgi:hypothetical protein